MLKIFNFFGIAFILIGITIFLNSSQRITGLVIYNNADTTKDIIVGSWFILTGLVLFFYKKRNSLIK